MLAEELAARIRQSTVSKIHSGFEKLVFLASLRDPNTGLYRHADLVDRFGPEVVDQTLRTIHEQVFVRWLAQALEEK